jgi:hypothetical protein
MDARRTIAVKKAIHKMAHTSHVAYVAKSEEDHINRANIGTSDVRYVGVAAVELDRPSPVGRAAAVRLRVTALTGDRI